jgi:ketosteroid isomerase-like protein
MSQENVDFFRRAAARLGHTNDLEAVAELFHPDAELRDLQHAPDVPPVQQGRAAIVAVWEQWMEALDDWTYEILEYVDADPWVVCAERWHAIGKGSDVAVEWNVASAYELKDDQIVRGIVGYPDIETALQDLDQSE